MDGPRFANKGSGHVSLNHAGAPRQALCFGWIDGQARGEDEKFVRQFADGQTLG